MAAVNPIKAVGWALGALGQDKNFSNNPVVGSRRLNERGFHVARVRAAHRMARFRRGFIAARLPAEDRAAFDRDGFVCREDHLPPDLFARVLEEVHGQALPAREMRQGQAVTRQINLSASTRDRTPACHAASFSPHLNALTDYAAGRSGRQVAWIETVIAEPSAQAADPQTSLHMDTFFPTAKWWLFLHDVAEDEGPFAYVPGSHVPTEARLKWEHEQSLTARDDPRLDHAQGSFRITGDEAQALGYAAPRRFAVRANTLVIGDTYGFHARTPSSKPTTRISLHGRLRRNPFAPWNGLDWLSLPGIRGRELDLNDRFIDAKAARTGRTPKYAPVGEVRADAPAVR